MLEISFIRAPNGKLAETRCMTPEHGEIVVSGEHDRIIKGRTGKTAGEDGLLYRMIVALSDCGLDGERFSASDGRMVCLEGKIGKLGVPVAYGGVRKRDIGGKDEQTS